MPRPFMLSRRSFLRAATAAALTFPPFATVPLVRADVSAAVDGDAEFARLSEEVMRQMRRRKVPGVAVGIVYGDREWNAGFGVTSVSDPQPVDADTLFLHASITKTYTATAIMRLVDMGVLDLDAPVRAYLPMFAVADEATSAHTLLKHLVTHTGGWYGDFFVDTGANDDKLARYVARMRHLPQITPLGAFFSYDNSAFGVLGRIIEVVTGAPYEAAMRTLVLDPLGLAHTSYSPDDFPSLAYAVGHTVTPSGPMPQEDPFDYPSVNPFGGIVAGMRDTLRYARFHLGDGTASDGARLLSQGAFNRMHTIQGPGVPDSFDGVGVSWFINDYGPARLLSHDGSLLGQESLLTIAPDQGFASIILTNSDTGDALASDVSDRAIERFLGAVAPDPGEPRALSPGELAPFVGRYGVPGFELYDLRAMQGHLRLVTLDRDGSRTRDPPQSLRFYAGDRTSGGDFLRKPDGSVGWLRLDSRIKARLE